MNGASTWQPDLALGVAAMDGGHEAQAHLVDALVEGLQGGADAPTVQALLLRLVDHTSDHFAAEQELMRLWSYPAYEAHVEEHNRLLDHVSQMLKSHAAGEREVTLEEARALAPWLTRHILGMDRALAAFLRGAGLH